jgi:energy-coupling factor transporter ATP-binding protein EcfA2
MQTKNKSVTSLPSGEGAGQIWMIDERELFEMLELKGKEWYGEKFLLWKEDYSVVRKLSAYFFSDDELAKKNAIDLKKGVLLSGPVGCGKTSLMNLVRCFLANDQSHIIRPCREIAFEFLSEGFDTIRKYSKKSFYKSDEKAIPVTYCFDDLGQEMKMKYYGNECEVMREIILSRYDMFESFGMLTHCTTNMSLENLELRYGESVASRLIAMTNFVSFENTFDKRK